MIAVSHQGGLSSEWFLIRAVSRDCGLSLGCFFMIAVSDPGGFS